MKYLITVYDKNMKHTIETLEEDNFEKAIQTSIFISLINDCVVEMIDNYTGELHFSKNDIKHYLSVDARRAIIACLK